MEEGNVTVRIIREIAEFILAFLETMEYDVFIMVTRKGYWICKIAEYVYPERFKKVMERMMVCSDRYLTKCLDFKEFKDKRIIIFDDSITKGNSLFFYYALLLKNGAKSVKPVSYALSTFYPSSEIKALRRREYTRVVRDEGLPEIEINKTADELAEQFQKDLESCVRMVPEELSQLSIRETCCFHEAVLPMVVDLPMFSRRKKQNDVCELTIKRTDWEKICKGNSKWQFVNCDTEIEEKKYHLGFFQMIDHILYSKFRQLFFNFIVRYKLQYVNEDEIKVVFVPFAIVNSCKLEDILNIFRTLFEDTLYFRKVFEAVVESGEYEGEFLEDFLTDDIDQVVEILRKNHNMCRALYRAIIFDISNYIGLVFKEYVQSVTEVELEYDWNIMTDNFDEEFIETMRKKCELFDEQSYTEHILQCDNVESVEPVDFENILCMSGKADDKVVESFFTERIIQKKYDRSDNLRARMMTIETLCYEAKQKFVFESEAQFRKIITSIILKMTENSSCGNDLFVDNDAYIMYRGFRAGENSELFLDTQIEWVYYYVLAFFLNNKKEYQNKYDIFTAHLEQKFNEEGYIGKLLSERDFYFGVKYFREIAEHEKIEEQILNKWYLLDAQSNNEDERRRNFRKQFCDNAFRDIHQWSI